MGEVAGTMPPNTHPQAYLTAIAQKYDLKGIFYLDLWPMAYSQVVLAHPEPMDQVTVVKTLPIHIMADDFLAPIVGRNSIAGANGVIWKKTHNAMAPAFSWSHIRNLTSVMADEAMHFRHALDRHARTGDVFSMEEAAAALVFDVIARIVFNFPLHAQTKGSLYLDDLQAMIRLAEAQFSWNPLVRIAAFFERRTILRRLDASIVSKIEERLGLLRRESIVPSRKDPFSILDLMLRERLQEDGPDMKGRSGEDLTPEYLELLVTK
jgi:cytochrome P450